MQGREQGFGTFSIVGADPRTGEVGVAVASKFLAVGSVVPFAQAGVGAVATHLNPLRNNPEFQDLIKQYQ
jgi:uncharacterized Ntn-hydrolase superfamily protein